MKKLMTSQSVFENLKQFHPADPEAVRQHDQSVRDQVVPQLKKQLQRKEQGVAARAKNFKVF
jgi:hypothetical protein